MKRILVAISAVLYLMSMMACYDDSKNNEKDPTTNSSKTSSDETNGELKIEKYKGYATVEEQINVWLNTAIENKTKEYLLYGVPEIVVKRAAVILDEREEDITNYASQYYDKEYASDDSEYSERLKGLQITTYEVTGEDGDMLYVKTVEFPKTSRAFDEFGIEYEDITVPATRLTGKQDGENIDDAGYGHLVYKYEGKWYDFESIELYYDMVSERME